MEQNLISHAENEKSGSGKNGSKNENDKNEKTENRNGVTKVCKSCGDRVFLITKTKDYQKLREIYECSCGAKGFEVNFWA